MNYVHAAQTSEKMQTAWCLHERYPVSAPAPLSTDSFRTLSCFSPEKNELMDITRTFLISLALYAWRNLDFLSCKALLLCFILFIVF